MVWARAAIMTAAFALIFNQWGKPIFSSLGLAVLNYLVVEHMLPRASPALIKAGLIGRDRLKKNSKDLPEMLGALVGCIYILSLMTFVPSMFFKYLAAGGDGHFPHSRLAEYLSGILSLQSMLVLGVCDDLFDLRWRHKFFLPAIAAIPMLVIYYVDFGVTRVVIPAFLRVGSIIGPAVDLGWIYYAYMGAFSIFSTNCINIYAGVNGLEVGQSVVVGVGVLVNDLLYLIALPNDTPAVHAHLLSSYILLPFLGGSLALLRYNWYPAQGFVGDTYCYLSGMVFAVVGILGHFSKTMLFLFGPQVANFIYSIPQLFHIVPCPRHRMPLLDPATGKLLPSRADVTDLPKSKLRILEFMEKLGLLKLWKSESKIEMSNLTLITLVLVHSKPLREDELATRLLILQALWAIFALTMRHMLARIIFGLDNL